MLLISIHGRQYERKAQMIVRSIGPASNGKLLKPNRKSRMKRTRA